MLLCKQNSHENSSSPIIWVSSLSLFANAEEKRGEKRRRRGGGRGKRNCWTIPCSHRIPATNCCWKPGSCAKQAVAGVEPWKKSCSCWLGWRQRITGLHNQSEKNKTSQEKKNHQNKTKSKRGLIENLHVWRQPWIKRHSQLLLTVQGWSCSHGGKDGVGPRMRIRISSDLTAALTPFHRISGVARDLWRSPSPRQGHLEVPQGLSRWVWDVCREGDSRPSLSSSAALMDRGSSSR